MLDLTVQYGPDGHPAGLEVTYAGPRVLISRQLLVEIYSGRGVSHCLRGVTLTPPAGRPLINWTGSVLRVEGTNRTVIYRIGEYYPEGGYYEAVWPD